MKKFNIFLLILMAFSCFLIFENNNTHAETNYSIKISTNAIYDTEKTDLEKYLFYSDYTSNDIISFVATVYDDEAIAQEELNYTWYDITNEDNPVLLSNTNTLTLDKIYTESGSNLIYVGTKQYQINVFGDGISEFYVNLTVDISDTSNKIIVTKLSQAIGVNQNGQYLINQNTQPFQVNAMLSKLKVDSVINWFLKTPNSSSFILIAEGPTCAINPSSLITAQNGYGEYKLFAGAQSSSLLFTSPVIRFKAIASELDPNLAYTISSKVIENTKAEVEAFTFTLQNASIDGIDCSKIVWYINNQKQATGESFTYEPTNNETFKVEAKYQGASLTPLAELETSPKSTGTLKLVLIVVGVVAVLSLIFGISVKTLNRRRDVTW